MSTEDGLKLAKAHGGGSAGIARGLRITPQAVGQWRKIPAERVLDVERLTGVQRHRLRPDIYPASEVKQPVPAD